MHLVKCWKFKELNVEQETVDPYRYISNYKDLKVTYLHGKYDEDYFGFKKYIEQFKSDNLEIVDVDYKISNSQTHNIRPWLDRNLRKFI
jgi:uncharacterized membrane protein